MAKKRHYAAMKSGEEYSTRGESMKTLQGDSRMIHEDRSAPCLLPREVMDKDWPRATMYSPTIPSDLFTEANKQMKADEREFRSAFKPGKY